MGNNKSRVVYAVGLRDVRMEAVKEGGEREGRGAKVGGPGKIRRESRGKRRKAAGAERAACAIGSTLEASMRSCRESVDISGGLGDACTHRGAENWKGTGALQ